MYRAEIAHPRAFRGSQNETIRIDPHLHLIMKSRIHCLTPVFAAAAFAFFSLSAQALPKAAEDQDAPVTAGTDVVRPKPSTKTAMPKKPAGKSGRTVKAKRGTKTGQPPRAIHRKK